MQFSRSVMLPASVVSCVHAASVVVLTYVGVV
jgi:hypothetical protein